MAWTNTIEKLPENLKAGLYRIRRTSGDVLYSYFDGSYFRQAHEDAETALRIKCAPVDLEVTAWEPVRATRVTL